MFIFNTADSKTNLSILYFDRSDMYKQNKVYASPDL